MFSDVDQPGATQLKIWPRRGSQKTTYIGAQMYQTKFIRQHTPNTFSLHLKTLFYTQVKFCLKCLKHINKKNELMKVMKNDIVT